MPALKKIVEVDNVAPLLKAEQLEAIGKEVVRGYTMDRSSRSEWEQRQSDAIKLALQVMEMKSFPWENCSNVKFPLVTVASLQFLSRMAILTKGRQIVRCDVIGQDRDGLKAARAKRLSTHMSYQRLEEDKNWIDDDEKAKLAAAIVGCAFKKTYFDPISGITVSEHVPAADLVVDYSTRHLDKCNRITHLLRMTANDLREREASGVFVKMDPNAQAPTAESLILQQTADMVEGTRKQSDDNIEIVEVLEQDCLLDLDDDGYQEPYTCWVRRDTGQVLRILARFFDIGDVHRKNDAKVMALRKKGETLGTEGRQAVVKEIQGLEASGNPIVRIDGLQRFVKIPFVPSPDGGFYDLGLGALLGPVNESVNTLINQLIDSGTMSTTAGGFLGRGVKIKGGKNSFDPFEWKPVDSSGDDLRKNIFPLPVREPSNVLLQLLGILIEYGEKIGGATDIMTGISPGQNTPAETSRNTLEQGMKLFSGIYIRMFRAFKRELEILYKLNQLYMPMSAAFADLSTGSEAIVTLDDYLKPGALIRPSADPAVSSEAQRQQRAIMLKEAAGSSPGYNRYLVEVNFLEAFDISDIDNLYPDPQGPKAIPPIPNPKVEIEKGWLQLEQQKAQTSLQTTIAELFQQAQLNDAKIQELMAKAEKLRAEASVVDTGQEIALINAQIGAAKAHQQGTQQALAALQKLLDQGHNQDKLDLEREKLQQMKGKGTSNDNSVGN